MQRLEHERLEIGKVTWLARDMPRLTPGGDSLCFLPLVVPLQPRTWTSEEVQCLGFLPLAFVLHVGEEMSILPSQIRLAGGRLAKRGGE